MVEEILEVHEIELFNVKHVYYQNSDNKTLFVSFAGMIDKYVSISWFYDQLNIQGNFLFLKNDPDYNSYMDDDYENLLKDYIDRLNIDKLIMFGPSMGGIGAIFYGIKLKADCIIAIDPNPINYDFHELVDLIRETNFGDNYKTKFFINYTFIDEELEEKPEWTEEMIKELQKKNVLLNLQPYRSNNHLEFIPSKDYLLNIIELLLYIDVSKYSQSKEWV